MKVGQRWRENSTSAERRKGREGLAHCRGSLLLAQPTWLGPANSQVSTNLRRLRDSESDTPRSQCGREPPSVRVTGVCR